MFRGQPGDMTVKIVVPTFADGRKIKSHGRKRTAVRGPLS